MMHALSRVAGVLSVALLSASCATAPHAVHAEGPLELPDIPGPQHIERLEWHRNVDAKGEILDTGDAQFTVLNSATVTDDSLQILTGDGFQQDPQAERRDIRIPYSDIVEIRLITHPLWGVNMVLPLNAGTWGSRVLITTKDGAHELLSIAKGGGNSPELLSPTRGVFLPNSGGTKVIKGLWWPDRTKTR